MDNIAQEAGLGGIGYQSPGGKKIDVKFTPIEAIGNDFNGTYFETVL